MGAMSRPTYGDLEEPLRRSVHQARAKRIERQRMTNAIAVTDEPTSSGIVVHREVSVALEFTPQQRAMIRDTYANGATEKEFQVLLEIAKLRRLNPLLRQIHFVKRWNKALGREVWSAQVSVDGLRAIAERTGKYDGQDEPEFGPVTDGFPEWCKVKVYRKDWTRPAVGVAYWSEYVQKGKDHSPTRFWAEMPRVMLAKCAEAIAMRKAFPEDMGGLYVDEEMQQADNHRQGDPPRIDMMVGPGEDPDAPPVESAEVDAIFTTLNTVESAITNAKVVTYDDLLKWREQVGTKGKSHPFRDSIRAVWDSISPNQRHAMGKTMARIDRQLAKHEGLVQPPAIEATFLDGDDGVELEPGSNG